MKRSLRTEAGRIAAMIVLGCIVALMYSVGASADADADAERRGPGVHMNLVATTQGPLWPPSESSDENGDYVLVGNILTDIGGGQVVPLPGAAIVSRENTVPPLDQNGMEDFSNQLGAPYVVERHLDLSRRSEDLNIVLHSLSFGPPKGSFAGGWRIPMEGESTYNHSSVRPCSDLFPTESQEFTFKRPSIPLHKVPIHGFEGDGVVYDPDTGEAIPKPDERIVDYRPEKPITLGQWLEANGRLSIRLTRFDEEQDAYTHAKMSFRFRNLIPDSVYSTWRTSSRGERVDPLCHPNVFVTDHGGSANITCEVPHPFPDPAAPDGADRTRGLATVFHSDAQSWGACAELYGPGVEVHGHLTVPADFATATMDLVTKRPMQ